MILSMTSDLTIFTQHIFSQANVLRENGCSISKRIGDSNWELLPPTGGRCLKVTRYKCLQQWVSFCTSYKYYDADYYYVLSGHLMLISTLFVSRRVGVRLCNAKVFKDTDNGKSDIRPHKENYLFLRPSLSFFRHRFFPQMDCKDRQK